MDCRSIILYKASHATKEPVLTAIYFSPAYGRKIFEPLGNLALGTRRARAQKTNDA